MRFAALILALGCACSGSDKKYYMPVDSPALPFTPPEAEDLVGGDGDSDGWGDDGGDGGDGDGNDAGDKADPEASARAIAMTLVQSRPVFESCYTKALEKAPTLRGRVELVLVVGAEGKPTSATASGLAGVAPCVARVAKGLIYPRPAGGKPVTISHPFVFAPST